MMRKVNFGFVMLAVMVFLASPSFGQAGDPNLVAYWTFDEGTGTIAYDSAGGNDGTIYDANWAEGKIGGALSFDGSGDYVDCGTGLALMEVCVCAWIKTSNGGGQIVFSKRGKSYGGHQAYSLVTGDLYHGSVGTVLTRIKQPGSVSFIDLSTTERIDDGEWHFIAMSYDGMIARIYIDGDLKARSSPGAAINYYSYTEPALIGATGSTNGPVTGFFDGEIDEVMIFNRALSAEEVEQLYWEGLSWSALAIGQVEDAIAEKIEALENIDAALEKEWAAYDALEELLASGDYEGLSKRDLAAAQRKIESSIRRQERSQRVVRGSIDELEDALLSLGWEPEPNVPEPNVPVPGQLLKGSHGRR